MRFLHSLKHGCGGPLLSRTLGGSMLAANCKKPPESESEFLPDTNGVEVECASSEFECTATLGMQDSLTPKRCFSFKPSSKLLAANFKPIFVQPLGILSSPTQTSPHYKAVLLNENRLRHSSTAAAVSADPPQSTDSLPSWESGPERQTPRSSFSFYDVTVERYAAKPLSTLTLKKMLSFGENASGEQLERKIIKSAQFVQGELPVRLAKRLLDLQLLPYIVVTNPHIKRVYDAYHRAFLVLKDFPEVTSMEQNQYLTMLLTKLVDEHGPLLTSLAKGLKECTTRPLVGPSLSLDPFLDNMLRSRISRRVIAEQHICFQQRREGYIGVICTELSVAQVLGAAVARTEQVCRETYGTQPQFQVTGDSDTIFSYIPPHLDYMFYEILKNASRAVVEHHSRIASSRGARLPLKSTAMPPIIAQICKGNREVTIKISDQGGGIDEDVQPKIWKYGYTSVDPTVALGTTSASAMTDFRTGAAMDPMAGLGFGLPVSRLYAQYFGGNIELMSIPGYGTDVYLRIHHLGNQSEYVEI